MVTNLVTVTPSRDAVQKADCAAATAASTVSELVLSSCTALFVGNCLQGAIGHRVIRNMLKYFNSFKTRINLNYI